MILPALNVAYEAETNRTAEVPHADWAGFYSIMSARDPGGTGFAPVAPGAGLDALIVAHLQPWAIARMEAADGVADDTGVCLPDGIFRYPVNAGAFFWLPVPGRIGIVSREVNTAGVRCVFLDREHPRNPVPSWNGDSVGHREDDVLTIDSTGFNDKSWLMPGREPHTEDTHMIEKAGRVLDGSVGHPAKPEELT